MCCAQHVTFYTSTCLVQVSKIDIISYTFPQYVIHTHRTCPSPPHIQTFLQLPLSLIRRRRNLLANNPIRTALPHHLPRNIHLALPQRRRRFLRWSQMPAGSRHRLNNHILHLNLMLRLLTRTLQQQIIFDIVAQRHSIRLERRGHNGAY